MNNKNYPKLIIVNGFPRSGKDTFITYCIKYLLKEYSLGFTYDSAHKYKEKPLKRYYEYSLKRISTIDTPKRIMLSLGWNGEKTVEMRNALSDLKDWWCKYLNGSFKEITSAVNSGKYDIIFTTAREPEEINKLVDYCEKCGITYDTVLVERSFDESLYRDLSKLPHSDKGTLDCSVEYTRKIYNNGSLEDLKSVAEGYCEFFLKK